MNLVIALGGHALVAPGEPVSIAGQFETSRKTCARLVDVLEAGHKMIITHGNGPMVGAALRRVELTQDEVYPLPLGICNADTAGGIGYMLQQVLGNELRSRGREESVVTIVTQVIVDDSDPDFAKPTKPVGTFFPKARARKLEADRGWMMKEDSKRGWRRVVPSPKPKQIVEADIILDCAKRGIIPIAVGGGGVPVVRNGGMLDGVEAVIDKDLASALLAQTVDADHLVIVTDVPYVLRDFGKPTEAPLKTITTDALQTLHAAKHFAAGSMSPKVQGALNFVRATGKRAVITDLTHLLEAIAGNAGTQITA